MDRKYIIIDKSELLVLNLDEVIETSVDTLRWSLDGTFTFIKFEGDVPLGLEEKRQYSLNSISEVLGGGLWSDDRDNN
jgi:hypothetical protein